MKIAYSHWRIRDRYYRLLGSKCDGCGKEFFPPVHKCRHCGSAKLADKEMPKEGKILTYTILHDVMDGFEKEEPMAFGIIELTNHVKVLSQIVDVPKEKIAVGDKVKAVFRKIAEDGESGVIFYGYKFTKA